MYNVQYVLYRCYTLLVLPRFNTSATLPSMENLFWTWNWFDDSTQPHRKKSSKIQARPNEKSWVFIARNWIKYPFTIQNSRSEFHWPVGYVSVCDYAMISSGGRWDARCYRWRYNNSLTDLIPRCRAQTMCGVVYVTLTWPWRCVAGSGGICHISWLIISDTACGWRKGRAVVEQLRSRRYKNMADATNSSRC